jgi:hypothetical protein
MIQKEDCSREVTRNTLLKQHRERKMDRGLCGEENHGGKNVSSRCRDSDYAIAESYHYCCKCGEDNHNA